MIVNVVIAYVCVIFAAYVIAAYVTVQSMHMKTGKIIIIHIIGVMVVCFL